MKNTFHILLFLFVTSIVQSQNIVQQSFETSGDTWLPLTLSTSACSNNNDIWDYSTEVDGLTAIHGIQFWGIRDDKGTCLVNEFESMTLPNVNISAYSDVVFSFEYYAKKFDTGDYLKYELFFDNISQGESTLVIGEGGGNDDTNGWKTETIPIPDTVTDVSVILSVKLSEDDEKAAFDNVKMYQSTDIIVQSFEPSGDTWLPITFSSPPCSNNDDIWDYSIEVDGLTAQHGTQFWGIRDDKGKCGPNIVETISLPNVDISSYSDVIFSFNYYAKKFDIGDFLNYELFYDNISQGQSTLVIGEGGGDDDTNGWKTETVIIPQTVTDVSVIFSIIVSEDDEKAAFDNVKLSISQVANDFCFNAIPLTVGNNSSENVLIATNENAIDSGEWPEPSCANYNGGDLWFTAEIPASGILNIETLDAGEINDTGLSVYTGVCGNLVELDCDDDGGNGDFSLINLNFLPNTTVFIRVWQKNNNQIGKFNIVAYTTECPLLTKWKGDHWDQGPPNSFTSALIEKDYDTALYGSFESCDCEIEPDIKVYINANDNITVHDDLTVNGTLDVLHEGSLMMINNNATISTPGTVNIHKISSTLNNYRDFTYWSSPVVTTIEQAFVNVNPNRIFKWDIPSASTYGSWSFASDTLETARGYIAEAPIDTPELGTHSIMFTGPPNNGFIDIPVGFNDDGFAYSDYNLIGNPYPSALDATLFLDDPLNTSVVNGTIYLWTHNSELSSGNSGSEKYNYSSNDYASFTSGTGGVAAVSGGPVPNGFIASGQGFFIQAASNGNVTFNNSMRAIGNNDQFFKATKIEEDKDRIWLNLSNDKGAFSQILIGFMDGATDGIDRSFDGRKYGGSHISFYSIIDEKNFVIQGRSHIKEEEKIKLGLYSYIEQNDDLKISIDKIEGNLSEYDIYLTDKLLNIVHDLKVESYTFIPEEKGVFNDRFELFFAKSSTLSLEENSVTNEDLIIINNENQIEISTSNGTNISNLKVYNILGQDIVNLYPNKNNTKFQINNLQEGTVLILTATLENNMTITKKFLVY